MLTVSKVPSSILLSSAYLMRLDVSAGNRHMERELAERSIFLHLVSISALGVIWRPPLDERQYTRLSSEEKKRVELGGEVMKGASREKLEKKGARMMIDNALVKG